MHYNFYTALDIPPFTSDERVIKAAYRQKIRRYHPDSGLVDPELARNHTDVLNQIYHILRDPVRKADYDRYLYSTANNPD